MQYDYHRNESMAALDIPLGDVYSDAVFNTRGAIRMPDVVDLARDINTHGLLQPITVQPYDKEPGYKLRIVLGHRRFAAFQFLQRETIPAIIREGLSEIEALALNFIENVHRKDLNILEEAYGVQRFLASGETVETTAKLINKGRNWVHIRKELLKMPAPIQEDAAAGWLTQSQILDLSEIGDYKEQLEIVRAIKEAKGRGEKRLPDIGKKKSNPTIRKKRNPSEILDMIEHIIDETGVASPFTRSLAWANGEINDVELYREMIDYFKSVDVPYSPPLDVSHLIPLTPSPGAA